VIKFRSGDPRDLDKQSRAEQSKQHETLAAATVLDWSGLLSPLWKKKKRRNLRRKWRQKHEQSAD
jgi:RNA polymerase-interacting CarD/CdnL/TRCF family regulator